jgi:predicted AAA+ superfamily ATPase
LTRGLQDVPYYTPFLAQSDRFCRKWHSDYISLIVREDLRDISRIADLDKMESLPLLLAPRLMSPLSMPKMFGVFGVAS